MGQPSPLPTSGNVAYLQLSQIRIGDGDVLRSGFAALVEHNCVQNKSDSKHTHADSGDGTGAHTVVCHASVSSQEFGFGHLCVFEQQ